MSTLEEHRKNIIKIIENNHNNINELKNYVNINKINLKELNDNNFDLLIFTIEKNASSKVINYIITQCQYETLNYSFNAKQGYEKYNTDLFIKDINFFGFKIPLFSAIILKNFEVANLLIQKKADINYGKVDIISYLCYINTLNYTIDLDDKIFKFIINNGFYIKQLTTDFMNKLIYLIQKFKNKCIELIFTNYIFDNSFIINLLSFYKNKKPLSQIQFQKLIKNEKNKLSNITENLYKIAVTEKNYEIIGFFMDYDNNEPKIILNNILKFQILEKAVKANKYNLVEKILNYKQFEYPIINIENIIIEECKYGNIEKVGQFLNIINVKIIENLNFKRILLEISQSYEYCYDDSCMKFIVGKLLKLSSKNSTLTNIDISLIKNYSTPYLNLILNVLLEMRNLKLIVNFLENDILKNNTNINAKDIIGTYPIIVSIRTNNIEIFKYLLNCNINNNVIIENIDLLFSVAYSCHNYIVIQYLLKQLLHNNDNIYRGNYHPIIKAIYKNQLNIIKEILHNNNNKYDNKNNTLVNENSNNEYIDFNFTPLILSYLLNRKEIFNYLMKCYSINELDSYGNNLFYYAIMKEDIHMLKYLINIGIIQIRMNKFFHSSLDISMYIKNKEIFYLLLDNNNNLSNIPNKYGDVPLITIIKSNNYTIEDKKEMINYLIKKGADINYISKYGYIPLIYAIQEKSLELVNQLIENDAEINYIDSYGDTPLVYAVKEDELSIVKLLIEKGAEIDYIDENGYSLLNYAIQNKSLSMINLLIENGININININISNNKIHSPFESAILCNSLPIVILLMEHDININKEIEYSIMDKNQSILMYSFNNESKNKNKKEEQIEKIKRYEIFEYLVKNYKTYFTGNIVKEIIESNRLDLLKILLLNNNLYLNIKDKEGNTPLANAIKYKKEQIINYLIHNGADIYSTNQKNETIYDLCNKYLNNNNYHDKIIFYKMKRLFYSLE
ncbi:ankyrin [Anaeromyces robustus]|uniref:Ankyrin n=1 Tax=Anaeromyces robustus TaxID=1754192 RepID=A0A1Y1WU01_9FUNG|nr:ankyrin [Anaeromyces robustus]|eukprot:ORX76885.1 ankyrin [Anaeromyces robustus]